MKVLIVKTSSLGDIVQTFPVLDYLKHQFPIVEIHWVVESAFAEIVRCHPQVDQVIAIESKNWRGKEMFKQMGKLRRELRCIHFDVVFDLQGNVKSSLVTMIAKSRAKVGFGWKTVPEWPAWFFTHRKVNPPKGQNIREDYMSVIQSYFQDKSHFVAKPFSLKLDSLQQQKLAALFSSQQKPILVCPSAAWPNKCLSEEGLLKALRQLNKSPLWFVWGNPAEREQVVRLSSHFPNSLVLEKLSLPLLQNVMMRCELVVAMDSLPLHLCGTTSTPSLSFFGPSSAKKYQPLGSQHRALQGTCPYSQQFEKRCPKLRTCPTGACLK